MSIKIKFNNGKEIKTNFIICKISIHRDWSITDGNIMFRGSHAATLFDFVEQYT